MNALISKNNEETYIFLNVENSEYMLSSKYVVQILELPLLECPQKLPKNIAGLLEYKNSFINVLDLKTALNFEPAPYKLNNKVIIIEIDGFSFAILVDEVLNIQKIDKSLIKDTPYDSGNDFIKKIYNKNKTSNILLLSVHEIENYIKNVTASTDFVENSKNLLPRDDKAFEILKKRALELKNKKEITIYSILDDINQYISLKVNDEMFCVKNFYIKSFYKLSKMKITPVPCTLDFVLGLLNFRGDYICVIDLVRYFNRGKTSKNDKTTVVITENEDFKFAFLVDEIGQVLNIDEKIFEKNATDEIVEYVEKNRVFSIVNMNAIVKNKRLIVK